jgi:hypothetical protein
VSSAVSPLLPWAGMRPCLNPCFLRARVTNRQRAPRFPYRGATMKSTAARATQGNTDYNGSGLSEGAVALLSGSLCPRTVWIDKPGTNIDASFVFHGFLRAPDGNVTTYDPPGSITTYPMGINPAGEISGSYADANSVFHGFARPTAPSENICGAARPAKSRSGTMRGSSFGAPTHCTRRPC